VVGDRVRGDIACLQELVHRKPQRDPTPGDRGAARAAIGLDHIAIDGDLPFAQCRAVDARPQGASDKPLNFLRSPGLLACRSLAPHPRVVARGSMPYSAVTQPRPVFFRNGGTRSSRLAVHRTWVRRI
jgi:hypothetical protein